MRREHGPQAVSVWDSSISGMQEGAQVVVWSPRVEEAGGHGVEKWFVVLVI